MGTQGDPTVPTISEVSLGPPSSGWVEGGLCSISCFLPLGFIMDPKSFTVPTCPGNGSGSTKCSLQAGLWSFGIPTVPGPRRHLVM